jgi:hypothetical protein
MWEVLGSIFSTEVGVKKKGKKKGKAYLWIPKFVPY